MKLAAVAGAVITVCGLLQLAFGTVPAGAKWMEYYKQSTLTGTGGGWLGGVLTSFLTIGLGKPGTFLVLVVLFIICMVCITERSFVSAVKRGGDKAYQYAREDMDRRRELHAIREEERRRIREEQRVRGVNLNATRLMTPEEEDYDEEHLTVSLERIWRKCRKCLKCPIHTRRTGPGPDSRRKGQPAAG